MRKQNQPYPQHAEIFVVADSGQVIRVRCMCPKTADHYFEKTTASLVLPDLVGRVS